MSTILVGSELSYDVRKSTVLLLKISAAQTDHQKIVHEELTFNPQPAVEQLEVGLDGNRIYRTVLEPGKWTISYRATIDLQPEVILPAHVSEAARTQIPADVLPYSNASRYCESDLLARFAFEEFGSLEFGYQRVQAICDWVHDFLDYTPGSTNATTTASDVLLMRTGVCRDYAHLAISLCRGIGIPARYVWLRGGGFESAGLPRFHGSLPGWQVVLVRSDKVSTTDRVGANWNRPRCRRCGLRNDQRRRRVNGEIGVGLAIARLATGHSR